MPVAYLWTRTVTCKNPHCRATVPLVKQTWLCKKEGRYVALKTIAAADKKQVRFEVVEASAENALGFDPETGSKGGNAACPFCGAVADSDYIKAEGCAGRLSVQLMAVVLDGPNSRRTQYVASDARDVMPQEEVIRERIAKKSAESGISVPTEAIDANPRSMDTQHFGFDTWASLFTPRQMLCLLTLSAAVRGCLLEARKYQVNEERTTAVVAYLALAMDRLANYLTTLCVWRTNRTCVLPTFARQSLPMVWDFGEMNPFAGSAGDWSESINYISSVIEACSALPAPATVVRGSATACPFSTGTFDAVVTDPPYYDNVSYSNLSDFFYVWLKRTVNDLYPEHFASQATPKRNEIIAAFYRHAGDRSAARHHYERSMAQAFIEAHRMLKPDGSLTVVYAHKTTLGWSTLVDALRVAGFQVVEAWPIDTEMTGGMRTEKRVTRVQHLPRCPKA